MPRRNIPRRDTTTPPAAHLQPAAATAAAQAKPPHPPSRCKETPKNDRTPNRSTRLTEFKPGFEQETEEQLARAFKRPIRKFKEDDPFYPWLPITPRVNFHLNFKF
nr:MAG: hypothetical protein [Gammatorquevirus sp.]